MCQLSLISSHNCIFLVNVYNDCFINPFWDKKQFIWSHKRYINLGVSLILSSSQFIPLVFEIFSNYTIYSKFLFGIVFIEKGSLLSLQHLHENPFDIKIDDRFIYWDRINWTSFSSTQLHSLFIHIIWFIDFLKPK